MRNTLQPYKLGDQLQYHEIVFDIGTPEKGCKHAESMKKLVDRIKRIRYDRVEILIYTHSETTRGDIWGGYEDDKFEGNGAKTPVAYAVDDVS